MDWYNLETFSFGDSAEMADKLAALVLAGIKTATCWAAVEGPKTEVGKLMVALSGDGRPLAVVETIELTQRRFDEVQPTTRHRAGVSRGRATARRKDCPSSSPILSKRRLSDVKSEASRPVTELS